MMVPPRGSHDPRQQALVEAIGFGGFETFQALRPRSAELEQSIGGSGPPLVITALTNQPAAANGSWNAASIWSPPTSLTASASRRLLS